MKSECLRGFYADIKAIPTAVLTTIIFTLIVAAFMSGVYSAYYVFTNYPFWACVGAGIMLIYIFGD